jgi:serine/threonine protein kinase
MRDVVRQLFSAIDTIHTVVKYIHGDIKPDNVMIDFDSERRPRVKIIDFGLARPIDIIYDMHQYIETIYWRAPELLAEDICDLAMTDVWATAVTAIDIMTGIYSIHALGARSDIKPNELYSILVKHCLIDDAILPNEWSRHVHEELHEFTCDIFKRYLVLVEERAGLRDLPY